MLKLPKPPWVHKSLTGSMASESDGAGQMVTDVLEAPGRKLRKVNSEAEVQTNLYDNFVKYLSVCPLYRLAAADSQDTDKLNKASFKDRCNMIREVMVTMYQAIQTDEATAYH